MTEITEALTPFNGERGIMRETIVLIDHPIGRRDDRASRMLRERGYEVEWYCPGKGDEPPVANGDHVGAIVYGGPESANDGDSKPYIRRELDWIESWVATGKPFLGICLGAQLLARALGGRVNRHDHGHHEIGYVPIEPTAAGRRFLPRPLHVYHWHNEGFDVPPDSELLAVGEHFPHQAFRYRSNTFGIQFHPEVTPEVFRRWIEEAGHMLEEPGAHAADRQIADAERFDPPMEAWLSDFLDDWLGRQA